MIKHFLLTLGLVGAGHFFTVAAAWCLDASDKRDGVPAMYLSLAHLFSFITAVFCWVGLFLLICVTVGEMS